LVSTFFSFDLKINFSLVKRIIEFYIFVWGIKLIQFGTMDLKNIKTLCFIWR
jgi:hypothetical protein